MTVKYLGNDWDDGWSFGQSATDVISFYGVTPVAQRSGADQAAVGTAASTTTTPHGYATGTQADGIFTLLNEIRATLVAIGIFKGSA